MSEEEIERAKWEAEVYGSKDAEKQDIVNLRIEAGQLLQNTEYMLHEHRKDWDKQTKKQVKEACQRLSKAIGRSTPEKIDEVTASNICEELMKIQIAFFEELGMQKIADHCVRIMEDYRKGIGKRKESDCR